MKFKTLPEQDLWKQVITQAVRSGTRGAAESIHVADAAVTAYQERRITNEYCNKYWCGCGNCTSFRSV